MRRKAETVNFVPAGRWDDRSAGTNALDLANRLGTPAMVFSAEHYAPIVHNWVCWAAPVHDPVTGRAARRDRPLDDLGPHPPDRPGDRAGAGAADRERHAALRDHPDSAPDDTGEPGLTLTLLGTAEARLDGQRLLLNRRQTEILALLASIPRASRWSTCTHWSTATTPSRCPP